ncbi:MAG TPA: hypothetical protein VFC00_27095 [Micromonosporaceae bacterium]|nr:hypothetical protein [Micromonosporaceae bacterium]
MERTPLSVWVNDYFDEPGKSALLGDLGRTYDVTVKPRPPIGGGGIESIISVLWTDPVTATLIAHAVIGTFRSAWTRLQRGSPQQSPWPDPPAAKLIVTNGLKSVEHSFSLSTPEDRRYGQETFGRALEQVMDNPRAPTYLRIEFDEQRQRWRESDPPTKG